MKPVKARGNYKCYECKNPIKRGDTYYRKSKRFGKPSYKHGYPEDETSEKINGIPTVVVQAWTMSVTICDNCVKNG